MTDKQIEPTPKYYSFEYRGIFLDLYRIADILGIKCPVRFQAFKKIVRNGNGYEKSAKQDIEEARDALNRKLQMLEEEDK